ncbi:MAG: aldehyde ferredoxin oxidoreductase family protein [Gammaproteobacteria bacterium]|nr:aldehyde ferredoxin oxidoreductase family protein [Gammaproteobacteria bacterium]
MGWQKRILSIDLSRGTAESEPLNMAWADQYIGQRGLGSKYLYENMDPAADAMSPDNVLIFATGPLTATAASTSARYSVITKGALTNTIACSNSGGRFGAELKNAGYDLMMIKGRAQEPVYIHIEDDRVEILPAGEIWGTTVWQTEEWIHKRHQDPQIRIASIGRAGECGVRYACVMNDTDRAAGRTGVGAVMGSKHLKAISVRGKVGTTVAEPMKFLEVVRQTNEKLAESDGRKGMSHNGTQAMMESMNTFGGLPTRNFQDVQFVGADRIDADAMWQRGEDGHRNMIQNAACFGCTIACQRVSHVNPNHWTVRDRPEYQKAGGGLEYETAFAFGPMVGVDDIDALTFAGFLTNEHGMDPMSFGGTLAAAMELYEMGVITQADTDGVDLKFGSAEALCTMVEKTGKYEGFGQILGLGAKRLCEKYGHPEIAMHVKGQEFAGYDSRALQGMGLGYATGNRGACHMKHDSFGPDTKDQSGNGKAKPIRNSQDSIAVVDSSGLCIFPMGVGWRFDDYRELLNAACGRDWSKDDLRAIGERIWNLERRFNELAGFTGADDTLPRRLLETPAPSGTAKGKVCELDLMLKEYYELRGWNEDGSIPDSLLQRLEI